MDKTTELTEARDTAATVAAAAHSRLERLVERLTRDVDDVGQLGEMALEVVLDLVSFERGFLLALPLAAAGAEGTGDSFELLASRARRAAAGAAGWAPVRNAEFAVSRALVKRALAEREVLAINDCLLPAAPGVEAQHRAVLCVAFDLARDIVGVVYLDRSLGHGELGAAELDVFRTFRDRCVMALAWAYAAGELETLRGKSGAAAGALPRADAAEEDDAEEAAVVPEEAPSFFGIVGQDEKLQRVFAVIRKIKDADLSVCLFGESGTGKEMLARAIHEAGNRRERPFVAENCGAIPENLLESELFGHVKGAFTGADEDKKGLFETASGGTLFLDEIGDMSEGMQRKLLRVLQEGVVRPIGGKQTVKVDVRVICASNRDLKALVQKGTFRADLYYRLNVITIEVPPLRDRAGDIPALVRHLAAKICEEESVRKRFSQSALRAFCEYPWPGNIRELRNVLRRVLITCPGRTVVRKDLKGFLGALTASPRSGENIERDDKDLILRVPAKDSFNEIIEECERVVLINALKQCAWNKSRVTKALKIPRQSLYNKIAKYSLEREWGGGDAAADE